jgi:hypothetical protein
MPVTVSETKRRFIQGYRKPIAGLYDSVMQELLVQMHFVRHNTRYEYNEVRKRHHHLDRGAVKCIPGPEPQPLLPEPLPCCGPGVCPGRCERI